MIFRPSRERRGDDRFCEAKATLFVLGASAGIVGMVTERTWLVYVAIVLVAAGVLLRLVARRGE
ncbi:MAG: hypothetical protein ACT443_04275 [Gemmatimonadota bacterium]